MVHLPSINGKEPLLLCVGGPMDAVPRYLKLASRTGLSERRLKFVDHVAHVDVPYWIRAFDVAVAPFPDTEHYAYFMSPLKLFEYMAARVPIIISDFPSIRDVVQHGETAWLVKPADPHALALGIQYILDNRDLAQKLAGRAAKDIEKYTWEHRINQLLKRITMEI